MSIKLTGCGLKYATLLHQSGFKNTKTLSRIDPASLYQAMEATNANYEIVTKLPSLNKLETWIKEARTTEYDEITARGVRGLSSRTGVEGTLDSVSINAFPVRKKGKVEGLSGRSTPGLSRIGKRGPGQDRFAETGLPGIDRKKKNWP